MWKRETKTEIGLDILFTIEFRAKLSWGRLILWLFPIYCVILFLKFELALYSIRAIFFLELLIGKGTRWSRVILRVHLIFFFANEVRGLVRAWVIPMFCSMVSYSRASSYYGLGFRFKTEIKTWDAQKLYISFHVSSQFEVSQDGHNLDLLLFHCTQPYFGFPIDAGMP